MAPELPAEIARDLFDAAIFEEPQHQNSAIQRRELGQRRLQRHPQRLVDLVAPAGPAGRRSAVRSSSAAAAGR